MIPANLRKAFINIYLGVLDAEARQLQEDE